MLIQVLYDNLKLKDKVLTNKGVVQIKELTGRVEVITKEGEVFKGDILVGADGFHSTVHKVMWHQGKQDHPTSFAIESQSG
jgi:2-polyprenyl-6-methoxyphenol hydroxylase-like FAD-dependent oxidoreductase